MKEFGQEVKWARESFGFKQKDLAYKVIKEDGLPISAQFLNDIENGRRLPSNYVLEQIASVLDIGADYLYYLAGRFPESDRNPIMNRATFEKKMKAFRAKK